MHSRRVPCPNVSFWGARLRDGSHRPPLVYNVVDESDTTAHCRSPRSHDHRGHVGRPDEGLERGGAGDDRRTLARGLRATLRSSSRHFAGTLAHEAPTPHGGVAPPAHEPDSRKRRPCCRIRVRVRLLEGVQAGYGGTAARDSLDRTLLVRLATGVKRSAPCVASFRRTPVHLGSRYRCCVKFTCIILVGSGRCRHRVASQRRCQPSPSVLPKKKELARLQVDHAELRRFERECHERALFLRALQHPGERRVDLNDPRFCNSVRL